jgi:hypothetical protein
MIDQLENKDIDINSVVNFAISNQDFLLKIIHKTTSKNDLVRLNCNKILMLISKKNPEMLYQKWEHLIDLLRSSNNYHKLIALELIANLIKIDFENKFEEIFDEYFNIINSEKTMVAGHLAGVSGKIAKNKPNLQRKITSILLNIDSTHKGKQLELVKAYIIDSFSEYFQEAENKPEIITFVEKQINSQSPKTRKKAKEFLLKYSK